MGRVAFLSRDAMRNANMPSQDVCQSVRLSRASILSKRLYISSNFLPTTKEEVNVFARVCMSVCLSVSKITQKRVHGFG